MIIRCPKCKGKVKHTSLSPGDYWCWECDKHYNFKELIKFTNYIREKQNETC